MIDIRQVYLVIIIMVLDIATNEATLESPWVTRIPATVTIALIVIGHFFKYWLYRAWWVLIYCLVCLAEARVGYHEILEVIISLITSMISVLH